MVSSEGKVAQHDIFQFVNYSKIKGDGKKLNEVVLEELPLQFIEYARFKKLPVTFIPQDM